MGAARQKDTSLPRCESGFREIVRRLGGDVRKYQFFVISHTRACEARTVHFEEAFCRFPSRRVIGVLRSKGEMDARGRGVFSVFVSMSLVFGLCPVAAFAEELGGDAQTAAVQKADGEGDKVSVADEGANDADVPVSETQDGANVPQALPFEGETTADDAQIEQSTASVQEAADADGATEALSAEEVDEDVASELDISTLAIPDIPDSSETASLPLERPFGIGLAAIEGVDSEMQVFGESDEDAQVFEQSASKTATVDGVTYTYQNTTGNYGTGVYIVDATWSYGITIPEKIDGVDVVSFNAYPASQTGQMYHLDASKATALECLSTQDLMSLDVSNNPKLKELMCAGGSLDRLDVGNCTSLERLQCSYNRLTTLDVSRNPNLTNLYCTNNFLTHLDLSKNTKITNKGTHYYPNLQCTYNLLDNAKDLVAKYGTEMDTGNLYDGMSAAVLPQCYKTASGLVYRVENYWNSGPEQSQIKVTGYIGSSKKVSIPKTLPVRYDAKTTWSIAVKQVDMVLGRTGSRIIETLDASAATELTKFWCPGWDIRTLSLPKASSKLTDFDCEQNNLGTLDLSSLPDLEWLYCAGNNLTVLDVSKNSKLVNLSCGKNTHTDLGEGEVLRGNDLVDLDLSANGKLEYVICDGNGLNTVDVSGCVRLLNFGCYENSITQIDVSKNPRLGWLSCWGNLLTKLDVSANKALKELYCYDNYIADTKVLTDRFGTNDKVVLPQYKSVPPSRLAGDIALDTMAAITKQGFDSSGTVIVATAGGYWDALAASSLAGVNYCPILLTDGNALSTQTSSEIKRLKASKVYIVGGVAAVSAKVESSLKSLSGVKTVKRLAGGVAVDTALKIFEEGKGSWGTTAVVATSETFQDALSVSPYGFAKRAPIFLANASTHKLDSHVLAALKSGGFSRIVIVGGTAALSSQLESQQLKGFSCVRLAGPTAYETSGAIAKWCLGEGMTAANVGIATGDSYYDALAGAAFCGKNNSALVLVSDGYRSNVDGFLKENKANVLRSFVFGGPAAVSPKTYSAITAALR